MEKLFDLEDNHPLLPDKLITAEFEKVKFDYEPTVHDRAYDQFYKLVKGRDIFITTSQILRIRITGKGEFLLHGGSFRGTDWKDNQCDFYTLLGRYEKPIFRKEKDPATQEVTSTQISSHETIYTIPFTKQKLTEILEFASESVSLAVQDGPTGRIWGIQSLDDFKEGSIEDLVVSSKTGKSLQAVHAEKNQFTYEKRELKSTTTTNSRTTKDSEKEKVSDK